MARKIAETKNSLDDLKTLIPEYGQNKSKLDEMDKVCKSQNASIKLIMADNQMDSMTVDGWKATYSIQERTSLDEDALLEVLKKDWVERNGSMECPYIKKKEYVDMDALEDAMYNQEVSEDLIVKMKSCETVKKVETLRIAKTKEED